VGDTIDEIFEMGAETTVRLDYFPFFPTLQYELMRVYVPWEIQNDILVSLRIIREPLKFDLSRKLSQLEKDYSHARESS
jgi:hypothetical protein